MKKLILVSLIVFTIVTTSCVGVRAGANFASERYGYSYSDLAVVPKVSNTNTSSETGFYVGAFLTDLDVTDKLQIQPEIDYLSVKDLDQIQVPILAKYNFADSFNAYAGPNFGFILDTPEGLNSFNLGLDLGVSYDINENFLIEARYDYGLSNLLENGDSDNYIKLSNFQVGICYRFN
jgi:opacity protein-like surface antigen